MSSTQHQLIEQCATRLRGIIEALDNIHDTSPHRWSTDLDDVHSSAESLLALINDQAPTLDSQGLALRTIAEYPCPEQDNMTATNMRQVAADAITGALAFGAQASQPPAADHWLRPFYDIGRAEGQRTQDLAMLVRMLASSLKRHAPDSNLVARATNYLAAKGLAGTPLRDAPASVEQAGGDERAAFELFVRKHCGMPEHIAVNWDAKFTNDAWEGWQARAAQARVAELEHVLRVVVNAADHGSWPTTVMHGIEKVREVLAGSAPPAKAQHSVPDGYRLIRLEHFAAIKAQLNPEQVDAYRGRNIYDEDKVYANWNACRSALDEIKDVFQQIDWDAENELAELLAAAPGKEVPQAWHDVQAERRRQIEAEGWTPEHDDEHADGQMAQAAGCYALHAGGIGTDWPDGLQNGSALFWPWDKDWWKPSTARRDLVKACALALAEIERLDRAGISQNPQPGATTASS
ncbi:hypothetical protein APB58_30215 [Pseudomonas aeruginosa]|uniref:hypothetical protein n=1 Tax=Pseudomonas aeruginosa TaxID=287 RepID=UPI0009B04286|nr:hypothetical protein [Pseudomonas aeruginosa]OPE38805.1 hypothetical protein APB58_30215 [Pseudomonas aeruginosa]